MDVKPRLEGLSLRSGLKLWLNTTRSTTLWIVRHCSPYVPLLLCCLLESNKKAIVLCREVLARRGPEERRDTLYPLFSLTWGFPRRVCLWENSCGKFICNQLIWLTLLGNLNYPKVFLSLEIFIKTHFRALEKS